MNDQSGFHIALGLNRPLCFKQTTVHRLTYNPYQANFDGTYKIIWWTYVEKDLRLNAFVDVHKSGKQTHCNSQTYRKTTTTTQKCDRGQALYTSSPAVLTNTYLERAE